MTYPPAPLRYVFAGFAAIGVLGAFAGFALAGAQGHRMNFGGTFVHGLFVWLLFAALSPVALWTARRYPLERERVVRHLPAHAAALVVISFAHTLVYHAVIHMMLGGGTRNVGSVV